jgi:hypothetical protein
MRIGAYSAKLLNGTSNGSPASASRVSGEEVLRGVEVAGAVDQQHRLTIEDELLVRMRSAVAAIHGNRLTQYARPFVSRRTSLLSRSVAVVLDL